MYYSHNRIAHKLIVFIPTIICNNSNLEKLKKDEE